VACNQLFGVVMNQMESSVQILRSFSEIEAIRDVWTRMQWHPNADIDFYKMVSQSMTSVVRPHVLVLWRDGTPHAILAGRVENDRLSVRVGYTNIPGPKTRSLVFIYGGLLGSPSQTECALLVGKMLSTLRRGEAERVYFNHLPINSSLYEALTRIPRFYSRDYSSYIQVHRRLMLPANVAEFRGRLSPKVRSNLRWKANKLVKQHNGNVRIECLGKPSEVDAMIHAVESVAVNTYQRGLGVGFGNSREEKMRLQMKADRGWLRSFILYVEDIPCAFWSGTFYKETFHSEHMGYDSVYRQYSPGSYLLIKVIEELCSQGTAREVSAIDFGLGDAEYKRIVCDQEWKDACPCIFAPTLKGTALNAYRTPLIHLDKIGRFLLSDQLEQRVKRIWRERVARRVSFEAMRKTEGERAEG
jgi:hypothetical protein